MLDTLKIISKSLSEFERLDSRGRFQTLQQIKDFAKVEQIERSEPQSVCPVTKQGIRAPCELRGCKFWVEHHWTKNCALNFLLNQEKKDRLTVEQVSFLYKKSPQRVESIYKRSFKIVQRHYLKDLLRTKSAPQFTYLAGFCVTCQTKLLEEDLSDQNLSLGEGFGYCSAECKKQHPPAYFEIERFFEAEFLRVVEIGSELFNFFYLEEILGFQPNVLRNRLEKLREESSKKKKHPPQAP